MRVTGWDTATLRRQPARVVRAHFARIFSGLAWSPELAKAAYEPVPDRSAFGSLGEWASARAAKTQARSALEAIERTLWPEDA